MTASLARLALISLFVAGAAHAHAHLVTSTPTEGSVLAAPPASFTLTFSEPARVTALSVQREREPKIPIHELPTVTAVTATIGLPALSAGAYTVSWRVVAADGHVMSSQLHFTVAPPSPKADPAKH